MNISIDQVTAERIETLLPLVEKFHVYQHIHLTAADRKSVVTGLLGDELVGRIWLVHAAGDPVGYIAVCFGYSIEFGGCDAFLDEFFIEETHRGKGIGRTALTLVMDKVKKLGVRALHLEVERGKAAASALYTDLGFKARSQYTLMSRLF